MKISLDWLSDFVTWKEDDPRKIADRLTLATAEVEEVEGQGRFLTHCCVGKVLKIARHPNADRLSLADVETDKGTKRVVCGGSNLREGMLVAFAHTGATVRWHGTEVMTLAKTKIRGEQSEGMICAAEELDLTAMFPPKKDEHEIIDLTAHSSRLTAGKILREALGLNDTVLHINNTAITTRPDLFSHIGVARECVALGLAAWKTDPESALQKLMKENAKFFARAPVPFKVIVDCPDLVPYYEGCLVRVEEVGTTPEWMVRRLAATGWRSVSLPVDITNYVTMEAGMPMHSFDADDFHGDVRIRKTKAGERITTLDNVERALPAGAVVLSDDEGIFDLLGIMGGLRSSTKDSTKRIYLHAAVIDPVAIRRAILATGHRTEASTIYEKGIPRSAAPAGFHRAVQLMHELAPGCAALSKRESWGKPYAPKAIAIPAKRLESLIGVAVGDGAVKKILGDLGYGIAMKKAKAGATYAATPPRHRQRDVQTDVDIIEDVARVYGYDRIPELRPEAPLHLPTRELRIHALRDMFRECGYIELVPLSFVSPHLLKKCDIDPSKARKVQNPLGEETSLLQPSTIPHLLDQADLQIRQTNHDLGTFTVSRVFLPAGGEVLEFGALLARKREGTLTDDPFLRMKRDLTLALRRAGYDLSVAPLKHLPSYAHPGRAASLIIDDEAMGMLCEVHPAVAEAFGLPDRCTVLTLNVGELLTHAPHALAVRSIPRFPAVTYDLTVSHGQNAVAAKLLERVRKSHPLLEEVEIADIYAGKGTTKGECKLTLRCTYRSPERTLTEEEAKKAHAEVERLATA